MEMTPPPIDTAALRERIKNFTHSHNISLEKIHAEAKLTISFEGFRSFIYRGNSKFDYGEGMKLVNYFNDKIIRAQMTDDEQAEYGQNDI
jgi:hypothetical protein